MNKPRFLISLTVAENDYQQEQARSAKDTARRLNADVEVIFAENDAIQQSQQLLEAIQCSPLSRPNGIVCQPVGTALPHVARAAVGKGIGWALLNRDCGYIAELRNGYATTVFNVTVDQEEVGRIQGRQIGALLPEGGLILYILGPSSHPGVQLRHCGMESTKPQNVQVRTLRADWTERGAYRAVESWLRLSTSRQTPFSLVAAQNDNMVLGARKALEDYTIGKGRELWSRVPYIGCDASFESGQAWVHKGLLASSIVLPPTAGVAVKLLAQAMHGGARPPERTLLAPVSFPPVDELLAKRTRAVARG